MSRRQLQITVRFLIFFAGDEFRNGEASKTKSEPSSSTESGKRQRRPPGQWWVSSALSTEGADVSEHQPTAKKPKQRNAESVQSPAKRKKDQNLERLKKKEQVPSPSQKTNQAREKKPKRNKSGEQLRANPRKTKALQKVFVETAQELLDSGPLSTSPLPLAPRGHGTSPGEIIVKGGGWGLIVVLHKGQWIATLLC